MTKKSNSSKTNKVVSASGKFLFGGTKNVDTVYKTSKAATTGLVLYLISMAALLGMSYLHYKNGDNWLLYPFLIVTVLAIINIIYYRARKPQAFKPGDEWLPGVDTKSCIYVSNPACLKHV